MAAVIFVEVLDRLGRVQRRQRFDRFPIAIGRAYSNDVILIDRHVSPEHLLVRQNEQGLVIEDRDSLNGLFPYGSRNPVTSQPLTPGTEVRIGHTRLRFCTADQAVAPTVRRAPAGIKGLGTNAWLRVAALVTALLVIQATEYLGSYGQIEIPDVVNHMFWALVLLVLWAGLWAIGTRLAVHEFHLIEHMTVAAVALVVFVLVTVGFEYLDFLLSGAPAVEIVEWIVDGCVLTGLVYAHLTVASAMPPGRRLRIALLVIVPFFALLAVDWFGQRDDFSPFPHFPSELKPVSAGLVPKSSPAEFFAETESLEERLSRRAEAEKAPD